MKTKFAATLLTLACAAGVSFPAAAGETTIKTGFAVLAQLPVTALSSSEMAETRGTYLEYGGAGYVLLDEPYSAIQIPASKQPKFKAGKAIK